MKAHLGNLDKPAQIKEKDIPDLLRDLPLVPVPPHQPDEVGHPSGFGLRTAKTATAMGGKVVLVAPDEENLQKAVDEIRATGFSRTGLYGTMKDPAAGLSMCKTIGEVLEQVDEMDLRPDFHDIDSCKFVDPDPQVLADNIIYAINQPWGISIGDITVRVTGEYHAL